MGKKKWGLLLLAVLIAAIAVIPAVGKEKKGSEVDMEVSALYGDTGRLGTYIPLTVRLYGQGAAGFSGAVCFQTMESGADGQSEIYEYAYPVSVGLGEMAGKQYYVPLGQKSNILYVTLRDEDGAAVAQQQVRFEVPRETGALLIGLLDEEEGALAYLDDAGLNFGMVRTKLLRLDAESLPGDSRGLDIFDILLINNFCTETLSGVQREAVLEWVREGGILLFGTGERVEDVLGPFAEGLVELPYGSPSEKNVNLGVEYGENSPADSTVRMICADLSVPGGDDVLSTDEIPVLTTVERENGKIGVFPFDLADIEGFSGANPGYLEKLLTAVLGVEKTQNLYYYSSYGDDSEYWTAQSLVNTGSPDRLPNLLLYTAVILGYIVAAGPGLYLLLKRRGFGYYYGHAVILFSIGAAALVYLLGMKTRFQSEFYTYASVRDISGEYAEEITYLNIRTPDSRSFFAGFGSEYQITPVTKSPRYDEAPVDVFEKPRDGTLVLSYGEDETAILSRESSAFEPRMFKLTRRKKIEERRGILADVEYFGGEVSGTVTNGFNFPLENAALLFYGQVLPIGRMEAGETVELDGSGLLTYPLDMSFTLAEKLAGGDRFDKADISNQEYLLAAEKTNLYSFYIQKFFGNYTSSARVAAFADPDDAGALFSGKEKMANGMVMVSSEANVTSERGTRIYRSGLARQPKLTNTANSYTIAYNSVYGTDTVIMEYSLGNDITVENLSFIPVSDEFFDNKRYYYIHRFEGDAYFYNYDTKAYDRADLGRVDFSAKELQPYLSPTNSMTIKYVGAGDELAGSSASLPLLMVTGRER